MRKGLIRNIHNHEHWFAEWWSAVLLIIVGIYAVIEPSSEILHQSLIDGFVKFLPNIMWEALFIIIGLFQLYALLIESYLARGIASFCASILLLWGSFNICIYGSGWHFSLIAWGVFAVVNLYALERILLGVEVSYEHR